MSISLGLTGQPPHSSGGAGLCIICPQMQLDAPHFQGHQVAPPRFHLGALKNTHNESVKGYTAAPADHRLLVTQTEKGLQGRPQDSTVHSSPDKQSKGPQSGEGRLVWEEPLQTDVGQAEGGGRGTGAA